MPKGSGWVGEGTRDSIHEKIARGIARSFQLVNLFEGEPRRAFEDDEVMKTIRG
jgi:hypothetical protein